MRRRGPARSVALVLWLAAVALPATATELARAAWRYEPARYNGLPFALYRLIQIPFRLDTATG